MAQIFPSDIEAAKADGESPDELETLIALRDGLPEEFLVYHSVHWSAVRPQYTDFGEIDFVIVNNAGQVLVIEQKNGPMIETSQGLEKRYYGGKTKRVYSQVQRNLGNLRTKFSRSSAANRSIDVDYLIYCPDHRLVDKSAAAVDHQRTVDATTKAELPAKIQKLMQTEKGKDAVLRRELHDFLLNGFRIAPDVNSYKSKQSQVYRQLLAGLSDVIESLEFSPFRLRIVGTAGSGKTQVTMRFCERAIVEGKKPLLLCFNRPLADKLSAQAPKGVTVNTYHGFIKKTAESLGIDIDFSKADGPDFWRGIQEELLAATLAGAPRFDCLVVDEGQDFKSDWYDILQMFLADSASQLWLEDPLQNLRGLDPVELPGFVTYRETANFRTPLSIAGFIKGTLESEFEQRNLLPGLGVVMYDYQEPSEIEPILERRIRELSKVGFKPEDIAIVSCHGTRSTALANTVQIGKHKVRKFTGKYDAGNNQIYTDGDLTFDTIFRFKGQQAPAVILVDLDETIKKDEWARGILYCAMTRATVRLELVVHSACPWADVFRENLDED
tara:strand:- start:2043 stop:3707 length:1665 start_codon:yes stop_codon:yes gene_type:complete